MAHPQSQIQGPSVEEFRRAFIGAGGPGATVQAGVQGLTTGAELGSRLQAREATQQQAQQDLKLRKQALRQQITQATAQQESSERIATERGQVQLQVARERTIAEKKEAVKKRGFEGIPREILEKRFPNVNFSKLPDIVSGRSLAAATKLLFPGAKKVKAPTAQQSQAAGFANRIRQVEGVFTKLEEVAFDPTAFRQRFQKKLPRGAQSAEFKQFEQSERNLINSILRRESGAAISESEFTNARLQYIPQPGDDTNTLAQKKVNRLLVLQAFQAESQGEIPSLFDPGETPTLDIAVLSEKLGLPVPELGETEPGIRPGQEASTVRLDLGGLTPQQQLDAIKAERVRRQQFDVGGRTATAGGF